MMARRATMLPPSIVHDSELDRVIVGDGSGALCWACCARWAWVPAAPAAALLACAWAAALGGWRKALAPPRPPLPHRLPAACPPNLCLTSQHRPAPAPNQLAVLVGCKIQNSVLGQSMYVGRGSRIESSLLLGCGAWLSDSQRTEALARGERVYGVGAFDGRAGGFDSNLAGSQLPPEGRGQPLGGLAQQAGGRRAGACTTTPHDRPPPPGENCYLRRCVVDENATIGNNVQVGTCFCRVWLIACCCCCALHAAGSMPLPPR